MSKKKEDTKQPLPPLPHISLSSIGDIRARMAWVYKRAESGRMDIKVAARLVWILCQIRDTLEVGKIEPLLEQMEEQLNAKSGAPGFYRG